MVGVLAFAGTAHAQVGFRNLDRGRPMVVDDASPNEKYGFEFAIGYGLSHLGPSRTQQVFDADLSYGLSGDLTLGLELPYAISDLSEGSESGFAELRWFVLMNLTPEKVALPALALRVENVKERVLLELLATRSFGRFRGHFNAGTTIRGEDRSRVEPLPEWRVALGVDRTLIRSSTLLVAEAGAERELVGTATQYFLGIGLRRQIAPTLVFDLGAAIRSGSDHGQAAMTIGFSHGFAIAGLVPGTRGR